MRQTTIEDTVVRAIHPATSTNRPDKPGGDKERDDQFQINVSALECVTSSETPPPSDVTLAFVGVTASG